MWYGNSRTFLTLFLERAMRPIVKMFCLPADLSEERLKELHHNIVAIMMGLVEGVRSEDDLLVLFIPDMMKYGLGKDILVEIVLPIGSSFSPLLPRSVSRNITNTLIDMFPTANVNCLIGFSDASDGFWSLKLSLLSERPRGINFGDIVRRRT